MKKTVRHDKVKMENYVKDKRQERTDTEHGSGYEGDDRAGSRTAYSGKEGQKAEGEGYSGRMQYHPADLLLPFRGYPGSVPLDFKERCV